MSPIWIPILFSAAINSHKRHAILATVIATLSCLINFTASALLHNGSWSRRAEKWFCKIDYAGIFVMISGSCATIPILLVRGKTQIMMIASQWITAFLGVCVTLLSEYIHLDRVQRASIYFLAGISNLLFSNTIKDVLIPFEKHLLVALGISYSFGCLCYQTTKPNIWPNTFGYHEVFHGCCFMAAICTFLINYSILQRVADHF